MENGKFYKTKRTNKNLVAYLVKAFLATPAYLSIAWALMVSYQIFTQTAVTTVVTSLEGIVPF